MKFHGNLDVNRNVLQQAGFETLGEFPEQPIVSQVVFKDSNLYCCVSVNDTPVWIPMTGGIRVVVHEFTNQILVSVAHTFGTDVVVQCYNAENQVILPNYIDSNTPDLVQVSFNTTQSGKIVVLAGGALTNISVDPYELTAATAEELGGIKVGSGLLIDNGVLSAAPTTAGSKNSVFTATDLIVDPTTFGAVDALAFDLIDVIEFDPDNIGTVTFQMQVNPNWDLTQPVVLDVYHALDTADNAKGVKLSAQVWVISEGDTPNVSAPDHTGADVIMSSTDNTNKIAVFSMVNGSIPANTLSSTDTIAVRLSRVVDDVADTYTGKLQVLKIVAR